MKKLVFIFAFLFFLPSNALAESQKTKSTDGAMWAALSFRAKMIYSSTYVEGRLAGELEIYNALCSAGQGSEECRDLLLMFPYLSSPPKEDTVINIITYLDKTYSDPQNDHLPYNMLVAIAYTSSMEQNGWEDFTIWMERLREREARRTKQ